MIESSHILQAYVYIAFQKLELIGIFQRISLIYLV